MPVWFLWNGSTILSFSAPNQKVRNIEAQPHVMLALEAARQGGDIVTIEGTAELTSDVTPEELRDFRSKYETLMARIHLDGERFSAIYSQPLRITPTRVLPEK